MPCPRPHGCRSIGELKMNVDVGTVRLLGAVFLFVFVASLLSERLLASAARSGSKSEILVNIS